MMMSCILIIVILIGQGTREVNLVVGYAFKGFMFIHMSGSWSCLFTVGERLESGIKNALVLQSDEAVVLTAQEEFVDTLPDGKPLPMWSHDQLPSCHYTCLNHEHIHKACAWNLYFGHPRDGLKCYCVMTGGDILLPVLTLYINLCGLVSRLKEVPSLLGCLL